MVALGEEVNRMTDGQVAYGFDEHSTHRKGQSDRIGKS